MDDERYFTDLAAAFVRGKRPDLDGGTDAEVIARGLGAGLRLHKFKRQAELPRVRRVIGALRALGPASLLDVGSGRGTFLWPLVDAFPGLPVTAIDEAQRRVDDLGAVRAGGVSQLAVLRMDAAALTFADRSFDVVTALEVLEHLPDPARAISHLVRVADRAVVASVPSTPDDNPEHIHLFEERQLVELLRAAGARRVSCDHVRGHLVAVAFR